MIDPLTRCFPCNREQTVVGRPVDDAGKGCKSKNRREPTECVESASRCCPQTAWPPIAGAGQRFGPADSRNREGGHRRVSSTGGAGAPPHYNLMCVLKVDGDLHCFMKRVREVLWTDGGYRPGERLRYPTSASGDGSAGQPLVPPRLGGDAPPVRPQSPARSTSGRHAPVSPPARRALPQVP